MYSVLSHQVEVLGRGYESGAKPDCDWEDPAAREALVAELAADASAVLAAMQGRALSAGAAEAAELLAAVAGQDREEAPSSSCCATSASTPDAAPSHPPDAAGSTPRTASAST